MTLKSCFSHKYNLQRKLAFKQKKMPDLEAVWISASNNLWDQMSKNNGKAIPIAQWAIIEHKYKIAGLGLKRLKDKCDYLESKITNIPRKRQRVSYGYEETKECSKWIRPWHSFRVNYQSDSGQRDVEPEEDGPDNEPEDPEPDQAPVLGEEATRRRTRVAFFPITQEPKNLRTIGRFTIEFAQIFK